MVDFATFDGTADFVEEHSSADNTLAFPAGTTVLTIEIDVQSESLYETDETITVMSSAPRVGHGDRHRRRRR